LVQRHLPPVGEHPIALACVEEAGGGGRALIEAIVAGYAVQRRLCDADVMRLTGLVAPIGDEALEALEEIPLGDRDRPMPDAALLRKFLSLAEPVLGPAGAGRVIAIIKDLEAQASLSPLLDACSAAARMPRHMQRVWGRWWAHKGSNLGPAD
jgi:2-methylcitrate dehydratase PrpD